MLTHNCYVFRIYPTSEQEEFLFKTIGCARKTYNLLLDRYNELYEQKEKGELSDDEYVKLKNSLNPSFFKNKEECSYLKEVDSTALKYAQMHVKSAFKNFFDGRADKPKFKSRNKSKWSYTTCRASKGARNLRLEKGGKLYLPKMSKSPIKTVVSRNPRGTLISATIVKSRSNTWHVSLMYEHHAPAVIYPETIEAMKSPIGVDVNLEDLVVTSVGEVFKNLRFSYKSKEKVKKLDRILSRKREQAKKDGRKLEDCKNYQKAKIKRARAYEKVRNQREDMLHKLSTALVKNHDFIAIENLSVSNLQKNHCLAFAISDASWRSLFTKLEYKAKRAGGIIQVIDRFYASTQTCSSCGEKCGPKGESSLKVRSWTCSNCGEVHDRDLNAAKNIVAQGLQEFSAVGTTVAYSVKKA